MPLVSLPCGDSMALFRRLFSHSGDAALLTRPSGELLAANASACTLFGADEQALRERSRAGGERALADAADPRLAAAIEARARDGSVRAETRLRRVSGELFDAEVSSVLFLDDGAEPTSLLTVRDISAHRGAGREALEALSGRAWRNERMLAEALAATEASAAEFRILAESMPQIVWVTRPDGWHVHFNQHWMNYTGLTLQESLGHGWNPPFHPEDRERAAARWRQATESGEPYEIEYRLRRADGVYHWMLGRALPLRDGAGDIVKWFGTCTDIDELKQAQLHIAASSRREQDALRDLNAELEARVLARTAELDDANRTLAIEVAERTSMLVDLRLSEERLRALTTNDDPFWHRVVSDDRLLDIAAQFVGPDIALFGSGYFWKAAEQGTPVLWHQDGSYWPLQPLEAITLWLVVDESTPENGCMRVIPGSHLGSLNDLVQRTDIPNMLGSGMDESLVDESCAADIVLRPGDLSVHHPNIVHGSMPNVSGKRRCGLAIRYISTSTRIVSEQLWPGAFLLRGEDRGSVNQYNPKPVFISGRHMPFKGMEAWTE